MKGITKAAKQTNNRSLRCRTCPYLSKCNPEVGRICTDNFLLGFKKGVDWMQKQIKENKP